MKSCWTIFLLLAVFLCVTVDAKKKDKKKRDYDNIPMSEKEMFGSKSLRCLVCKALVEEFDYAIQKVDPKKKIGVGSHTLSATGDKKQKMVSGLTHLEQISMKTFVRISQIPYARSEYHLDEVLETVCKEFEEYAQAKEKSNGQATIIRIMSRSGGMNPRFSEIDIVPDDDLNTRLKVYVGRILCICSRHFLHTSRLIFTFQCEGLVEEYEDQLIDFFSSPRKGITRELCYERSNICRFKSVEHDEL